MRRAAQWGLCVILASLALPGIPTARGDDPAEPKVVFVVEAKVDEFVDRIEALGTTKANESVDVTSNITEKVVEIRFDDGQTVVAGDVLVVLDAAEEQADLQSAEAVLAEKRLAFQRAQELESRKFAATAHLDERRAALRQAEADIAMIRSRIADRIIRAPFGGVVGLRDVSVGALIEPGDRITTLDDTSIVKLDFSIPSTYLAALKRGLPIVARSVSFPGRLLKGSIKSIGSRIDPVTRSVIARATLSNADGALRPGLLMTVELLKNARKTVVVPESALVPRGRKHLVYVVDESDGNVVVRREVKIGARRPGEVEILSGLNAGETVIVQGSFRVRPGDTVIIGSRDDMSAHGGSKSAGTPGS